MGVVVRACEDVPLVLRLLRVSAVAFWSSCTTDTFFCIISAFWLPLLLCLFFLFFLFFLASVSIFFFVFLHH